MGSKKWDFWLRRQLLNQAFSKRLSGRKGLFGRKGGFIIKPSKIQQQILEGLIRSVIAGEVKRLDKVRLIEVAKDLQEKGAQGIILGCTELPLIFPKKFEIPVFNSLEILARALLRNYYK